MSFCLNFIVFKLLLLLLLLLLSYLQARTFCVKVCNRFGPAVVTRSGVPQGSVLGPFLFAAFMGSFSFSAPNVDCVKYADDVTLIESVHHNENSSITLDDCVSLFRREGLFVNLAKCKQFVFAALIAVVMLLLAVLKK